jgi:peroxiredoxin
MDAEILAISAFSPWSQLAFARTMELPYPLLSDFPNLDTIITYGVENRIGQVPTAKRAYFIIDKQGIIRFKGVMHTINPKAPLFPNQVLLDGLKKINNGE